MSQEQLQGALMNQLEQTLLRILNPAELLLCNIPLLSFRKLKIQQYGLVAFQQ